MKTLVSNRKAFFNYAFSDELTAGLALSGAEVKSLKAGQASLAGAYITIKGGQAFLVHSHITPYKYADNKNYNPDRERVLLLNKREISGLIGKDKGTVIIPLEIVETGRGLVKLKVGIGRGKKKFDKRESIKNREVERRIRKQAE